MSDDTEELETLLPDERLHIDGRDITVRELRFAEALRATPIARPIVEALRDLVTEHGERIPDDALLALLGEHHEAFMRLLSMATGESVETLAELSDDAGMALLLTCWRVNQRFFSRRLVLLMGAVNDDPSSTPSATSSPAATAPTPPSSPSGSH